jgi:hypothetical protein
MKSQRFINSRFIDTNRLPILLVGLRLLVDKISFFCKETTNTSFQEAILSTFEWQKNQSYFLYRQKVGKKLPGWSAKAD